MRVLQSLSEVTARSCDIGCIQDCGDNADALRAGGKDIVNILQVDAADREPGDFYIFSGPTHVIERYRLGRWLCAGGENRADGCVIRASLDSSPGLSGRVRAQADFQLRAASCELRDVSVTTIKKIFLAQMTELRANFARHFQKIIDDEPHICGAC